MSERGRAARGGIVVSTEGRQKKEQGTRKPGSATEHRMVFPPPRMTEDGRQKIYANIDYSKFRDDIDIDKAIEILNWTMYGFGQKGLQQINSFENLSNFGERYLKEWNIYAQILKHSFYKEDEV